MHAFVKILVRFCDPAQSCSVYCCILILVIEYHGAQERVREDSSFKSHCMTLAVKLPRHKFCMGASRPSTAPDPPSLMKVTGLAVNYFR